MKTNVKKTREKLPVDTGSTFSWIYEKTLKRLGVKPVDVEELETIEGRIVKRKIAFVEMEYLGKTAPTGVIFAQPKDAQVLGLHALESLRLEVDPFRNRLKKSKAINALQAA